VQAMAGKDTPPIAAHVIGSSALMDPDDAWAAAYGVDVDGAVLIRPDGYVAWRSRGGSQDPAGLLRDVLGRVLQR
jgi:hypothetical protein